MAKNTWNKSLPCMLALMLPPLVQAGVAGKIQFTSGEVRILGSDGVLREAYKGAEVFERESIITGPAASAQIKMIDGATLAMHAATHLQLEAYRLNDQSRHEEKALLSLLQGGLRNLVGLIGKRNSENYTIRTPNAILSVRGKEFEPVQLLSGTQLGQLPVSVGGKLGQTVTSLTSSSGTTLISAQEVGVGKNANEASQVLLSLAGRSVGSAKRGNLKPDNGETVEETAAAEVRPANEARLRKLLSTQAQLGAPVLQTDSARVLVGSDTSGNSINTASQILSTSQGGTLNLNTDTLSQAQDELAHKRPAMVSAYFQPPNLNSGSQGVTLDQTGLGQQLTSYNQLLKNNASQQLTLAAAVEIGKQNLSQATFALDEAKVSGNKQPSLIDNSQQALEASEAALKQAAFSQDNDIGGSKQIQQFADLSSKLLARYQQNLARYLRNPSADNKQALALDLQALSSLGQEGTQAAQALSASREAVSAAQQAANLALQKAKQAQQNLAAIPSGDANYVLFKAAAEKALSSAQQAQKAVDEALAIWNNGNQLLSQLNTLQQNAARQPNLNGQAGFLASNGNAANLYSISKPGAVLDVNSQAQTAGGARVYSLIHVADAQTKIEEGALIDQNFGLSRVKGGSIVSEQDYFGVDANGVQGWGAYDKNSGQFRLGLTETKVVELGAASWHGISGPAAWPPKLVQNLTGESHYYTAGSTHPTDSNGKLGIMEGAKLQANFSTQSVQAQIKFAFGDQHWELADLQIPLRGNQFTAASCDTCPAGGNPGGIAVVNKNGVDARNGNSASMSGSFFGNGLSAAGLQYSVTEGVPLQVRDPLTGKMHTIINSNTMQGVVAFRGNTQNTATAFRAVLADDGSAFLNTYQPADLRRPGVQTTDLYLNPVNRLTEDKNGMNGFVGVASTNPAQAAGNTSIGRGTAQAVDRGSVRIDPATTVNWGRWENGTVDIYSRDGSTKLATLNNQGRSVHFLNVSTQSERVAALPLTGSATYKLAGATQPSDHQGNLGTLTQAKVDVDFTTQRANTTLGVNFNTPGNTSNWLLQAQNTPISRLDSNFASANQNHGVNGQSHLVSCTGPSCGTQNIGSLNGFFIGSGASGLAINYDLLSGDKVNNQFLVKNNAHGMVILRK